MKAKKTGNKSLRMLILGIICLLLLLTVIPRAKCIWDLNQQKIVLEKQKAELLQENKALSEKMAQAGSPEQVEKIAREQLGMVKKGEIVIIPVIAPEDSQ